MLIAFYKGTRPGLAGLYNRGVRLVTKGAYSHAELIFSDGLSASASFADGGVRFKAIEYDPMRWDFEVAPDLLEAAARDWFRKHEGHAYDLLGNVHFLAPMVGDAAGKWSCAESIAEALGFDESWRYCPNSLAAAIRTFHFFDTLKG